MFNGTRFERPLQLYGQILLKNKVPFQRSFSVLTILNTSALTNKCAYVQFSSQFRILISSLFSTFYTVTLGNITVQKELTTQHVLSLSDHCVFSYFIGLTQYHKRASFIAPSNFTYLIENILKIVLQSPI